MQLTNTYWLLRHGQSTANVADIIVSEMANGTKGEWCLTDLGKQQADTAG